MLDKNDIEVLGQMFKDNNRDMRDFVRQEISASEKRIKIDVEGLVAKSEDRILGGVAEIVHDVIAPKLDDHEMRIQKLENPLLVKLA